MLIEVQETFRVQIVKVVYYNEDRSFQVLTGKLGNQTTAKLVIKSNRPIPLDTHIVVSGNWVTKEKFGAQFEVNEVLDWGQ